MTDERPALGSVTAKSLPPGARRRATRGRGGRGDLGWPSEHGPLLAAQLEVVGLRVVAQLAQDAGTEQAFKFALDRAQTPGGASFGVNGHPGDDRSRPVSDEAQRESGRC